MPTRSTSATATATAQTTTTNPALDVTPAVTAAAGTVPDVAKAPPSTASPARACVDGNEAAARVAYAFSEVAAIYPITPSSTMGELADAWSAAGRRNLFGQVPEVVPMQSEAGAAGAMHGALLQGSLATTFTASQGLLLMLPNMYKIAGELTPAVIHVAARAVATHALCIFGDHSDVMAARTTGWAMLAAGSVQQAHDFAAVAHAATLRARVPFVHFFDGFRTSHELASINLLGDADLRALLDVDALAAHRARGLSPDAPQIRGTAQNPDVFFQSREAANPFHARVPDLVQDTFDALATHTGRNYRLVEYVGAPDAEDVLILMGSGAGAAREAARQLNQAGRKVGVVTVHLYRPFPTRQLAESLPATVRRLAVLDRTKEPGAVGEPLYIDVVTALAETGRRDIDVIGGRYGLGGKEFTPAMAAGVYAELAAPRPRRHVTVGITDDVTGLSVTPDPSVTVAATPLQAVFHGLGSDGTVGSVKATAKLLAEHTGQHIQGYFVYDSKKAGSVTVSHLRAGPGPVDAAYLIESADVVAVHQHSLLTRRRPLAVARPGARVLLNSPYPADQAWRRLPRTAQLDIQDKHLDVYVVDAHRIARDHGLGGRVNTVMQACFLALTGLFEPDELDELLVASARRAYAHKGEGIVAANTAAIRDALMTGLAPLVVGTPRPATSDNHDRQHGHVGADAPAFVRDVTAVLMAGEGDRLPVSAVPADGAYPTGTSRYEKPGLSDEAPAWVPDLCTGCGKCTVVCPHGAIRMSIFNPDTYAGGNDGNDGAHGAAEGSARALLPSTKFTSRELPGHRLSIAISPLDCTGCSLCVAACPVTDRSDPKIKPLTMAPVAGRVEVEQDRFEQLAALPAPDRTKLNVDTVKGSQLLEPLFTFPGACAGCGETPYLKLLSQLTGDRLLVANATGCSSIFGANLPTTPWGVNSDGRGPAWANSLFEDNAEFGLGIRVAADQQHQAVRDLLQRHAQDVGDDLAAELLAAPSGPGVSEAEVAHLRVLIARLLDTVARLDPQQGTGLAALAAAAPSLAERVVWVVGGDGWAYDIGFGGLDHVLSSGRNLNILVLDTEVYSNTGGQASKATPRGAVARFASGGKKTPKKDLGQFARNYPDVYVAQVALGANQMQTLRAMREAQAWTGVSLVIAYASCVEHGIDVGDALTHQQTAVNSGYWPLYRHRPGTPEPDRLSIDSKAATVPVAEFLDSQDRFSRLHRTDPDRAQALAAQLQQDIDGRAHRTR